MHIPDGYLGPETYGALWAGMIGAWSYASRKMKQGLKESQVPFLAMASAFSFLVMIFALPTPGGTTAHITGVPLIAILLGPWASVIAVSVSLVIQAFVFGDGGLTAIGANCFNIALVGSLISYSVFWLVTRLGGSIMGSSGFNREKREPASLSLQAPGAALGAYIGMNAAAFCTAVELGLQPLIHGAGPASAGYFPYSLRVAIPAIMIPHLTVVGVLEAIMASLVVVFLRKADHGRGKAVKGMAAVAVAGLIFVQSSAALAHDFWVEQKAQGYAVVFGHGAQREAFEISKVKNIKVLDSQGKEIPAQKEKREKGLLLTITGQPSAILVEIDNGYWSKTIYGWKELPKRKASRVVEAIRSLFYSKMIISWEDVVQQASAGVRLDIIPMQNPFQMKAGETLSLKVVLNGKPLARAAVARSEHAKLGTTDSDGVVRVPLVKGHNLITVAYKEPIRDDPDADMLELTATLTFEVK